MRLCIVSIVILLYLQLIGAKDRHYYIAAVEVDWNYAPNGNLVTSNNEIFQEKLVRKADRIGSTYRKVIYRGFKDPSFTIQKPVPRWQGMLGPTLRVEVGDVIYIHFRNMASIGNFSMHPHGLFYDKNNEGALYLDDTSPTSKLDDSVPPGGAVTYIWQSTTLHAPTKDDDNCVAWGYHSHTDGPKDIDTGLVGIILNCRKGTLDSKGRRMDVNREFPLYADIVDENENYFIDNNLNNCGDPFLCNNLKQNGDEGFAESNKINHINGFAYGNLPPYAAYEGENVVWYIMSLNQGMHTVHVNGQTMIVNKKRINTVLAVSASFYSGYMQPMNPGRWLIYCRNQLHFADGMQAFLDVVAKPGPILPPHRLTVHPKYSRIYYIAIEEVLWNYAPSLDPQTFEHAAGFVQHGSQRIGSIYKKAIYVEYTDVTFTKRKLRGPEEVHYGLAGPPIRAEAGERVLVVVQNKATRAYSLLLNGVSITKDNEGAYYKNNPFTAQESGAIVLPGATRQYIFSVPVNTLLPLNDACTTFIYHSAVDLRRDIHTGLFGPLLVCKPGALSSTHKQVGVDREFILNWMIIDENLSWYIDENIKTCADQPSTVNKEDSDFQLSNQMRAINGYSFGTIPGLDMCLGERIKWHMYGLGEDFDHHHFSFEGNNFMYDGKKVDTGSVFPGIGKTVTMTLDQAGRLLLRNGQLGLESEGMYAFYNVRMCTKKNSKLNQLPPYILPTPNSVTRRYYVGIIEVDWEYAALKRDAKTGANLLDPEHPGYVFVRGGPLFVGSKYYKAVYRQYTDKTFTTMIPRSPEDEHLGIMGPFIRGNVGDVIEIVLKNMASVPYNIVPRNVVFRDGSPISGALSTMPGQTNVYSYLIPERSGPRQKEPNCVGTIYSSRVDPLADANTGLFGPFVICKPYTLDVFGQRTDRVTREFALGFLNFDENFSHFKGVNFAQRAPQRQDFSDPDFVESNTMHSVNGFIFANLKGLVFYQGELSAWYIFALGQTDDIHTIHFHSQLYVHVSSLTLTRDVVEIYPGTYETVEMAGYNPGTWLLHCHVGLHGKEGMVTTYTVLPKPKAWNYSGGLLTYSKTQRNKRKFRRRKNRWPRKGGY